MKRRGKIPAAVDGAGKRLKFKSFFNRLVAVDCFLFFLSPAPMALSLFPFPAFGATFFGLDQNRYDYDIVVTVLN